MYTYSQGGDFAGLAVALGDEAVVRLQAAYGFALPYRPALVFYNSAADGDSDLASNNGAPFGAFVVGRAYPGTSGVVMLARYDRAYIQRTVTHEVAHLFQYQLGPKVFDAPHWWIEGDAKAQESTASVQRALSHARGVALAGGLPDLTTWDSRYAATEADLDNALLLGASFVHFLEQTYGPQSHANFYANWRSSGDFYAAFDLTYGSSLAALDGAWRAWLVGNESVVASAPVEEVPAVPPVLLAPIPEGMARVNAYWLNMRTGPSLDHEVLHLLSIGQLFLPLGRNESGEWLLIELPDGSQGWLASEFVDYDGSFDNLTESLYYEDHHRRCRSRTRSGCRAGRRRSRRSRRTRRRRTRNSRDPMSGELILVVDDGKENRDFIVEYVLEPNGYQPLVARDGREGLELAREHRPALILLDLQMPHMDGLEVLNALDAEQLEIPVILMTFHGSEEIAVEVYRKGVRDYVKKPYTVEEMYDAIDRSLTEVRLRQERDQLTERLIAANAQLNQRVRELNVLYNVGKSVTALLDIETLMVRVVEAASQLTSCEEASVYILEHGGALRCKAISRQADHRTYPMDEIREDDLARAAIDTNEATVPSPEDLAAMRRNNPSAPTAAVATPLSIAGNPVGALVVKNLSPGAGTFTRNDGALLSALADYAAIAYENASHHERTVAGAGGNFAQPVLRRSVVTDVLDQALTDHEAVAEGGRRADLSILSVEVRGHQAFSKKAPPGQIVKLLNNYIELAVQAVFENQGTLNRLTGESLSAFFNAPTDQTDHDRLLVETAMAMKTAAEMLKEQRGGGLDFSIGLALWRGGRGVFWRGAQHELHCHRRER